MSKKIVVGVDDSETAARAARTAAGLARALDAELYVLTAYGKLEMERIEVGAEEFVISNEADAEKLADAVIADLRGDFPDVTFRRYPAEGKPGPALVDTARILDADLIVVGNKRVQGIARVLGSVARDVASRAHCDVYVAHTHQR